ncbi:helix-turn-helix domain-containing protein [Aquamicrobium terrae]|uniref:CRP/FNR family transcriptional activator FtrB n=1 Tax=Aquamicrobium terrae TaxID=1324945 RepID=A0ABV2N196_9HYPH
MRDDEKPNLRRLPLFREMMTPTFDSLMQIAYSQSFPAQLELIRQGEYADFLHVIIEGSVELHASWNGRDTVMGIVHPVSTFILAACVYDEPYLMSARTLERSQIVLIPVADVRVALRRDSDFAMAAMRELAGGYRAFVRQAKNLKLRNSLERLAAYILHQSCRSGDAATIVLPVEKRHLASHLGMTPENLSRSMKALQGHGVVVQGMRVTITDRARLAAIAVPDPLMDGPVIKAPTVLPRRREMPSLARKRG